jgi:hypothetical protein
MKKLNFIFTVFAFVALTTGSALAQTTIDASAEVQSNLVASQEQDLNFGVVLQDFTDGNPTIDPSDGTATNIEDATSVTVGFVSVAGTQNQVVDVSTGSSVTLTESNSSDEMTLTPNYNYTYDNLSLAGTPANAVEASNVQGGSTLDMTLDGGDDGDGENTILIGGSLSEGKTGALATGTYNGTVNVSVSYQ